MGETTHISWADRTWSPWTGCTKISPACDGCYAAHLMDTRMHRVEWGEPGAGEGTRDLMSDAYWRKPLAWNKEAGRTGIVPWVFPSLCDSFDTAVPAPWRWRFVDLMEATPNILWLLLTKRVGNVRKLTDPMRGERPLPFNHALLSTVVTQAEVNRDLDKLVDAAQITGPRFTGVSVEPMLEGLDLMPWLTTCDIGWVIAGGETDQGLHKARPSHPDWLRSLRDQCAKTGTPFHFKQWGEWIDHDQPGVDMLGSESSPLHFWTASHASVRIGKRQSGRYLDCAIHDARPTYELGRPRPALARMG